MANLEMMGMTEVIGMTGGAPSLAPRPFEDVLSIIPIISTTQTGSAA